MPAVRYNAAVADWFGREPAPLEGCLGAAAAASGGTRIRAGVVFAGAGERRLIVKLAFRAFACPHIIAACNLLAARLPGEAAAVLVDPALPDRLLELEIPVEKTGKILILQDALRACYAAAE